MRCTRAFYEFLFADRVMAVGRQPVENVLRYVLSEIEFQEFQWLSVADRKTRHRQRLFGQKRGINDAMGELRTDVDDRPATARPQCDLTFW